MLHSKSDSGPGASLESRLSGHQYSTIILTQESLVHSVLPNDNIKLVWGEASKKPHVVFIDDRWVHRFILPREKSSRCSFTDADGYGESSIMKASERHRGYDRLLFFRDEYRLSVSGLLTFVGLQGRDREASADHGHNRRLRTFDVRPVVL